MDTQLLVTGLGSQRIILGFPWLNEHNPDIDWKTGVFKWRTLQPLKVKRYHDKPAYSIRTIKADGNLEVKLHLDMAQIPTWGSLDAAGYDLYSAEDNHSSPWKGNGRHSDFHRHPTRYVRTDCSLKRISCQKHDHDRSRSHRCRLQGNCFRAVVQSLGQRP